MVDDLRAARVREARAAYAARRDAFRQAALPPGKDASPQSVEATLASISEEVTAEAIEWRRDKGKPR
jgi:hypothetical protein